MEQIKEISRLRKDVDSLKETVENLAILLNKRLMVELYEEAENIDSGEFFTEEEFEKKHKVKIH